MVKCRRLEQYIKNITYGMTLFFSFGQAVTAFGIGVFGPVGLNIIMPVKLELRSVKACILHIYVVHASLLDLTVRGKSYLKSTISYLFNVWLLCSAIQSSRAQSKR